MVIENWKLIRWEQFFVNMTFTLSPLLPLPSQTRAETITLIPMLMSCLIRVEQLQIMAIKLFISGKLPLVLANWVARGPPCP